MATVQFLNWIERQGQALRRRVNLSEYGELDPYQLAGRMGVGIVGPRDTIGLTEGELQVILGDGADEWSGGTLPLPGGRLLVVLNPTHAETRKRATLMEELSHIHLGHKPSQFILAGGVALRSFNKTQETQASWVGAAALVPRTRLQYAADNRISREETAADFGVSVALVRFRERTTGVKLA